MSLPEGAHAELMREAIEAEADAQRALLAGEQEPAAERLRAAAELYRASWEAAPPRSYGRLIGMLKAAVIAGDAADAAAYAQEQLAAEAASPAACYALAIAALVAGDDRAAAEAAAGMHGGSLPMERAADAITALAAGDRAAYADAIRAIVTDFEGRDEHLTGVAIADTALMLERIAGERAIAAGVASPLLPR